MESTSANTPPPVHVIVRLPFNRPPSAPGDPAPVIWTADKEKILWDALSRSQTTEGRVINWQALSQRLATPLPYLLYRAQARYEEGLKGLQDFKGALNPPAMPRMLDDATKQSSGLLHRVLVSRTPSSKASGESTPTKTTTPPPPSPRVASSKDIPHSRATGDFMSESTATLPQRTPIRTRPSLSQMDHSPSPSSESEAEDDDEKTEEEDRIKEESEQVGKRLRELEAMMSSTMLGFARQPRLDVPEVSRRLTQPVKRKGKDKLLTADESTTLPRGRERSKVSSFQDSIPSIPSPPAESRSPVDQSREKSISQTSEFTSSRSPPQAAFRGRVPLSALSRTKASEMGSGQGSTTSSFSDFSDASMSGSAMEDAFNSNYRSNATSKMSVFTRSTTGRGGYRS